MPSADATGFAYFDPGPLVLGLLTRGPRHGYQLYQEYQRSLADIWELGQSRLYAVLQDLRKQGAVEVEIVQQVDKPTKKMHRLTQSGRRAFQSWVHQPVAPLRSVRVAFLAKLRMVDLLELDGRPELIRAQIEVCRRVEEECGNDDGPTSADLVQEYRRAQAAFLADWLRSLLEGPGRTHDPS
jgi:DNA-binding PadR family transcriptional regulator